MKIIKRKKLNPSQLDIVRILMKRKKGIGYEEKQSYERLEVGAAGENVVIEYLKEYGQDHWVVLQNTWLEHFGICECDIALVTSIGIHLFEVKNYTDNFVYENGLCFVNGHKMKHNIVSQVEKVRGTLRDICREFSMHLNTNVSATLVFTGIDCSVDIRTPIAGIEIVPRNQFKQHILKIVEKEKVQLYEKQLPVENLVTHIEKYKTDNPFQPKPLTKKEIIPLRKGIYCDRCGSFDIMVRRTKYITCSCGYHEPREEAIVRTICEYGVLTYGRGLTKGEVYDFLGGQVSHSYLLSLLKRHFEQVKKSKHTYYKNKGLPFLKVREQFQFSDPKILYL